MKLVKLILKKKFYTYVYSKEELRVGLLIRRVAFVPSSYSAQEPPSQVDTLPYPWLLLMKRFEYLGQQPTTVTSTLSRTSPNSTTSNHSPISPIFPSKSKNPPDLLTCHVSICLHSHQPAHNSVKAFAHRLEKPNIRHKATTPRGKIRGRP